MSAPEPMAHHVLTPWTLSEDDSPQRRFQTIWILRKNLDRAIQLTRADAPPVRVLVNADLLDPRVPPDWLAELLGLIEQTPRLTWLLWTREPERWRERMIAAAGSAAAHGWLQRWREGPYARINGDDLGRHVWLGVRAETQAECDERIPGLLAIPAALRWLWLDPLAGEVDLRLCPDCGRPWSCGETCPRWGSPASATSEAPRLGWVVAQGGESPLRPAWVRALRDQCSEAGVPFRFVGWGEWAPAHQEPRRDGPPLPADVEWLYASGQRVPAGRGAVIPARQVPEAMRHVGAEASGRLLDGRTHDDVPESREVPRG